MFIGLQELQLRAVRFRVDVPAGEIGYDDKITQASPLHAEGTAELLSPALREIRVQGKLSVVVNAPCDRCLETAVVDIEKGFDLLYMPRSNDSGGENEIDEGGIEVGYYEGEGLTLNDALREVVLLALPMQLICKEECKGICPVCGQNRNQQDCGCHPEPLDDRWHKLKNFRPTIGQRN
jgi:uncharacterized protein